MPIFGEMDDLDISLKNLLDNALIGALIFDWELNCVYASQAALRLMELEYKDLVGRSLDSIPWGFVDERLEPVHPFQHPVATVKRLESQVSGELVGRVADYHSDARWFRVSAYLEKKPGEDEHGFIVMTLNDLTDRDRLFSFKTLVEKADDVIIVTEANELDAPLGPKIVYVNQAFERLTGYTANEVVGETPRILQGCETSAETRTRIYEALKARRPIREKILNYSKTGEPYWLDMHIVPIKSRNGDITHFAAIERNVSKETHNEVRLEHTVSDLKTIKLRLEELVAKRTGELRHALADLERLAFYDPLTELPNRRYLLEKMERQFSRVKRYGGRLMVGILDVDNFKAINDERGHACGDQVLKALGKAFSAFFRQEDAYGRLGGEEFAFAILLSDQADAQHISERLLGHLNKSYACLNDEPLPITVSLGVCEVHNAEGLSVDALLGEADKNLYEAKRNGKANAVVKRIPASAD